jgi:hypothetical protein
MIYKPEHNIRIASLMALVLYFAPNLGQDVHRVFGHMLDRHYHPYTTGNQISTHSTQCPVCVFEFTFVESIPEHKENTVISDWYCTIATEIRFKVPATTNFSIHSRAPPV